MYNKLPIINYDGFVVRDISKQLIVLESAKANASSMTNYIVQDGETPESLAHDFYDDSSLNWVILLANDIMDPLFGWPLFTTELFAHVSKKYGAGNEYKTHHWELDGVVVNQTTLNAFSVSNFVFEERLNEERRKIKIINEEWIPLIKSDLRAIL